MSIQVIKGNIWNTKCQVLVNTVNCEGVMGAGIALEARLRFPEMYFKYKEVCSQGLLKPGLLWLYRQSNPYWILNFPTKDKWKYPSKEIYIIDGLKKFNETYKDKGIHSIAFPILGGLNGGLDENRVIEIMYNYLNNLPLDIEIYQYSPNESDDFFIEFKTLLLSTELDILSKETKIRKNYLETLYDAILHNPNIYQVNQLMKIKGIGDTTLEKIFQFKNSIKTTSQASLF